MSNNRPGITVAEVADNIRRANSCLPTTAEVIQSIRRANAYIPTAKELGRNASVIARALKKGFDHRQAFTVVELMIVISIIALLAAMAASALSNAAEQARAQRTRAIITKIDQLLMEKWESYRTRSIVYARHPNPRFNARNRLYALRELQRMELPQTVNDVWDNPVVLTAIPSVNLGYRRKSVPQASANSANEEAECLYLILSAMRDGDDSALSYFTSSEIGDTDKDGMPEILDGWGQPIVFIRWPAGYTRDNPRQTALTDQSMLVPDQFDPIKSDPRVSPENSDPEDDTFALRPLVFSMGRDRSAGIYLTGGSFRYSQTAIPNDPFAHTTPGDPTSPFIGEIANQSEAADNITNHSN